MIEPRPVLTDEERRERRRAARARWRERNPETSAACRKSWEDRNPERRKAITRKYDRIRSKEPQRKAKTDAAIFRWGLRVRYGITPEDYAAMLEAQSGVCAICLNPPGEKETRLFVDHDHATGVVRGLLCRGCNIALGGVRDNPESLRRAIAYLENHKR